VGLEGIFFSDGEGGACDEERSGCSGLEEEDFGEYHR
jgi:hypothetical protein